MKEKSTHSGRKKSFEGDNTSASCTENRLFSNCAPTFDFYLYTCERDEKLVDGRAARHFTSRISRYTYQSLQLSLVGGHVVRLQTHGMAAWNRILPLRQMQDGPCSFVGLE